MEDIRRDLTQLARSIERIPSRSGGRQVMVIGTDPDVRSSSVSASLALLMSGRSTKSTWLIDLDLLESPVFYAFQSNLFHRTGRPGRAFDGSLNTRQFYNVVPELRAREGRTQARPKMLGVHQIDGTRLMVSRFRTELLKQGQRVQINGTPDFWHALRNASDWAIVDAPALDDSRAGLAVCRHMDGVIIVVQADKTHVDEISGLRDEIEAHGGHCLGVVVNGVKADARFADRIAL